MGCTVGKPSVLSDNDDDEKNPRRRSQRFHSYLSFRKKLSTDDDDDDDYPDPGADADGDGPSCPSVKSFMESTDEDGLRYLSSESFTEAVDSVADIGRGALAAILKLELKDDIAGKPELSSLVNDYFKSNANLLRFFIALCDRLKTACKSKTVALDASDSNVIEELLSERKRLYDVLVAEKKRLDKKLRSARKWWEVCFLVHKVFSAVVIISSVWLTIVCGPTGASTAATVAATSCLSVGEWLKSRWDAYELGLEEQRDAVAKMGISALSSVRMLRRVQRLVKRVDVAAESLLRATSDLKEKTAAAAAAAAEEEMENKLGAFRKSIDSAEEEVDRCRVKLCSAMAAVVMMVTKK